MSLEAAYCYGIEVVLVLNHLQKIISEIPLNRIGRTEPTQGQFINVCCSAASGVDGSLLNPFCLPGVIGAFPALARMADASFSH